MMMPGVERPRVAKALWPRLTDVNDAVDRRSKVGSVSLVNARAVVALASAKRKHRTCPRQ